MRAFFLLLRPAFLSMRRRISIKPSEGGLQTQVILIIGLLFWVLTFFGFNFFLSHVMAVEEFGDILARKLMAMVFLTFFFFLIFSNIITALSTYFLSDDLNILWPSPVHIITIYYARLVETVIDSSWMIFVFAVPVLLSYGVNYHPSWTYYPWCIAVLVPFILVPASLGIMATMILVGIFPARRLRDILALLALIFIAGIILLVRLLQPEKLINPDAFTSLVGYFNAIHVPDSVYLPSIWATDSLMPLLMKKGSASVFHILLLSGLALPILGSYLAEWLYFATFSKAREAKKARLTRLEIFTSLLQLLTRPFHPSFQALMEKDIRGFFRDPSQWSQIFILGSMVVLYLYNFKLLPLNRLPDNIFVFGLTKEGLQNAISFLNLALAGFVTAGVAVRFVFPSVSLEGKSFWILRSSPITMRRLLWSKFWMSFVPLLILAEGLVYLSNRFLKVNDVVMVLSLVTIFFMTFGIVGLGTGIGAIYPRFNVENVAKIATGFGGLVFMLFSIGFIAIVVYLEAGPAYRIILAQTRHFPLIPKVVARITFHFSLVLALSAACFYLPIRLGIRSLERIE